MLVFVPGQEIDRHLALFIKVGAPVKVCREGSDLRSEKRWALGVAESDLVRILKVARFRPLIFEKLLSLSTVWSSTLVLIIFRVTLLFFCSCVDLGLRVL
jgi:hypothetical protein